MVPKYVAARCEFRHWGIRQVAHLYAMLMFRTLCHLVQLAEGLARDAFDQWCQKVKKSRIRGEKAEKADFQSFMWPSPVIGGACPKQS